jgi:hypothetical protein
MIVADYVQCCGHKPPLTDFAWRLVASEWLLLLHDRQDTVDVMVSWENQSRIRYIGKQQRAPRVIVQRLPKSLLSGSAPPRERMRDMKSDNLISSFYRKSTSQ